MEGRNEEVEYSKEEECQEKDGTEWKLSIIVHYERHREKEQQYSSVFTEVDK